ncbi:hypothetical protein PSI22_18845 [Xenorhabdus sp. XENO-7]|uniref:Metalloprotease StcE beta-sandwich domain-containing protein n=1 Tax=Xenorhabdus aichiensis TaxID=3025874 RepID=A0ABT5M9I8_9GAMM|nr:hypothetical protein [Xenorhabdus aichiensis]MDC9623638.1 hypothetical protein [Xenorhabdus aichiensis]
MNIIEKNNPLKKPILPQEDENRVIDISKMANDFMLVVIEHFDTEKPKEKINILLNGVQTKFYFVENPVPFTIHITIPFSSLPDGDYTVTYTVTDVANIGYSEPAYVKIINSELTSTPFLSLKKETKNSVIATLSNIQEVDNVSVKFYIAVRIPSNPELYTYINTSDGNWSPLIILPATATDGCYIIIQSNAGYYTYISTTSKPSPDFLMHTNNKFVFKYSLNNKKWTHCSGNKKFPTSGDNVKYMTPNDVITSSTLMNGEQYAETSTDPRGQVIIEVIDNERESVTVFAMLDNDIRIYDSIELNFISDTK